MTVPAAAYDDLHDELRRANEKLDEIGRLVLRHAERRRAERPAEQVADWEGYAIAPAEIWTILMPALKVPILPPRPGFAGTCEGCHPDGNAAGRALLERKR